ncbi:MAG: hypothetical protein K2O15_10565 [Lachnospiraceae bacterium]|nr:hypothetical protein [Lachnospiraceae bacterium]
MWKLEGIYVFSGKRGGKRIDEDHFICYNDFGPYLIHLETKHIEDIKKDGEYYRWDIVRENGEVWIVKAADQEEESNE